MTAPRPRGWACADKRGWDYWWSETQGAMGWPDHGRLQTMRALEGSPERTIVDLAQTEVVAAIVAHFRTYMEHRP